MTSGKLRKEDIEVQQKQQKIQNEVFRLTKIYIQRADAATSLIKF